MRKTWEILDLFAIGGCIYGMIEVLWRGYTHWTMTALGGAMFVLFGKMNQLLPKSMPLLQRGVLGGACVTAAEFAAGCLLNRRLHLKRWDYSHLPFHVLGQICLPFSLCWGALSMAGMLLNGKICEIAWEEEAFHCPVLKAPVGARAKEKTALR